MNLLWSAAGGLFFLLGGIGLVLPVWPTTVFWILAAVCFTRSHPQARDWIYRRPGIGPQIEQFLEQGLLSWRAKFSALAGMTLGAGICALLLWGAPLWLGLSLSVISVAALYVVSRPSNVMPDEAPEDQD